MKITVYTITDCQYSKAEKDYLASHTLPYEEKNLETNKEFLTEMMTVSNNFAGTPVTKVEKDDGTIVVLKGFTQEEFDKTFGFGAPVEEVKPPEPVVAQPAPIQPPVVETPVSNVPASPAGGQLPTSNEDPLKTVLDTLQSEAAGQTPTDNAVPPEPVIQPEVTPTPPPAPAETAQVVNPTPVVETPPAPPSIPDFPPTTPNS